MIKHSEVYEFLENNFTLTIEERQMLTEYVNQQRRLGELSELYKKLYRDKLSIGSEKLSYNEFLCILEEIREIENDLK